MSEELQPSAKVELLATFKSDRPLAHQILFAHRHKLASPQFHETLETDWASDEPYILHEVFRNGAKSTIAEEGILLAALFAEFRYALLVGLTEKKAQQRLRAIKYEAETNTALTRLFGDPRGHPWSAEMLVFANGVTIQPLGRGQSLRGVKEMSERPDYLLGDDLEDKDICRKQEQMDETWRWFMYDLLPAMNQDFHRARILATPLHPDSLPMRIERSGDWVVRKIPAYHVDDQGRKASTWPELYPMTRADAVAAGKKPSASLEHMEESAAKNGSLRDFRCEYLMNAEAPAEKPFRREMIRIVPQARTWQPVWCMFDPARTVNVQKSARTGFAAWSITGSRLKVWKAWGKFLLPDEIINAVFEANEEFHPVFIGFEEDGLNEWALQPLRAEAARRGIFVPLRGMRAPRGKTDFIAALKTFYAAGEVEHNGNLPDLENELLSFPHGTRVDVANALAYCQTMRRGRPVFTDFAEGHVDEGLAINREHPTWLIINATRSIATGQLVQNLDGALRIYRDWAREGDPSEYVGLIADEAAAMARDLHLMLPPIHFDYFNNVGIRQALDPRRADQGSDPNQHANGRARLRDLLQRQIRGVSAVLVSPEASWTMNALAGGYALVQLKGGVLADYAEEGVYKVLMEGLESFCGAGRVYSPPDDDAAMNAVTPDGRAYKSMLGASGGRTLRRA